MPDFYQYIFGIAFILVSSLVGILVIRGVYWFYSHYLEYHKIKSNYADIIAYQGDSEVSDATKDNYINEEMAKEEIDCEMHIEEVSRNTDPLILMYFDDEKIKKAGEEFGDKIRSVVFYSIVGNALVFTIITSYAAIITNFVDSKLSYSLLAIAIIVPFVNSCIRLTALYDNKILDHTLNIDKEFRNSIRDLIVSFVVSLYIILILGFSAYTFGFSIPTIPLSKDGVLSLFGMYLVIIFLSIILGISTEYILSGNASIVEHNYDDSPLNLENSNMDDS